MRLATPEVVLHLQKLSGTIAPLSTVIIMAACTGTAVSSPCRTDQHVSLRGRWRRMMPNKHASPFARQAVIFFHSIRAWYMIPSDSSYSRFYATQRGGATDFRLRRTLGGMGGSDVVVVVPLS